MRETCQECVHFDEGMCKLKPGACLNYGNFKWSPMIMISPSDLESKYISRTSYDSLLKRAEAAEAKVAELEADAKWFIGIIDELGRKVAELETAIRWTPVSDPPKINFEYYLAALINGRVEKVVYDRSCRHHTMWMIAGSHKPVDKMITHWMPLPNPPQEEK